MTGKMDQSRKTGSAGKSRLKSHTGQTGRSAGMSTVKAAGKEKTSNLKGQPVPHATKVRWAVTGRAGSSGSERAKRPLPSVGQVCFCLMSTFCFILILRNADVAIEYMGRGLTLCARTVIPSLFPFMVISELLVQSGAGEALGRIFSRFMRTVFGLSGAGSTAVFLGSLCGFPVGAKTAVSLLDRNMISKSECEHLLTFSNNPSSAFLISAVGVSLFGNRRLGTVLYFTVLGSSFAVGFVFRFFVREKGGPTNHPHFPSGLHPGGVEMFTGAVSGAATGMLLVCAYVIFFSTLSGTLSCLRGLSGGMNPTLYACFCGFLEMSGGISEASSLTNGHTALILTAAIAGWSGLSVHCQIMSLCAGRELSFKPYVTAKVLQGLLSAAVMAIILKVASPGWLTPGTYTMVGTLLDLSGAMQSARVTVSIPEVICHAGFLAGLWMRLLRRRM